MEDYYWESRLPYEVHIADENGLIDMVDRYRTEHEARAVIPKLIADALASEDRDDYKGCHFALVRFEFSGMTDWQEPVDKFPVL